MDDSRRDMILRTWIEIRPQVDWTRGDVWRAPEPMGLRPVPSPRLSDALPKRAKIRTLDFRLHLLGDHYQIECEGVVVQRGPHPGQLYLGDR